MSLTDAEKLAAATSLLTKLSGGYFHFEEWPEGDGWLQLDGDADLTAVETQFLATIKKPEGGSGPSREVEDLGDDRL